ncbi:MAG TPA: response regulator [Burkholderiales bacterium]|nr:response regulator [Burkholderiales bacterium]
MDELNPVRVLVVEDNLDTAEALRCLLTDCGFHVAVAHNTQEGLTTARNLEPHVVLCDIGLPDGDGYMVGSVLRQSSCKGARLIAVTGHAGTVDRQKALAAGFDQHLAKPVDPTTLLREMEVTL